MIKDDKGSEISLTVEQKGSSLYLVCPACLENIKKPSSWHPPHLPHLTHSACKERLDNAQGDHAPGCDAKKSRMHWLKSRCARIASLLILLSFLGGFTAGVAALFNAIESPNEDAMIIQLNIAQMSLVNRAYDFAQELEFEAYMDALNQSLTTYDRVAGNALKHGITAGMVEPRWSFRSAMFYCVTIFTTIGYGNVCPTTSLGRITTIIYGLVAIPLFLIIIGKIGHYLAVGLNQCFVCYHTMMLFCFSYCCRRKEEASEQEASEQKRPLLVPSMDSAVGGKSFDEDEDELHAGPLVAVIVAVMFMLLGTLMYTVCEPWTFLEAFYFVFISLSTIGFGDFVPTVPAYFMLSSVYMIIGLALISMVINVLINFYTSAYDRAHDSLAQSKLCSICQK